MKFVYKRKTTFKNATVIKMQNKSTLVGYSKEKFNIRFRICDGNLEPRVLTNVLKNKAVETYFNLSPEAAISLCVALQEQIELKLNIRL